MTSLGKWGVPARGPVSVLVVAAMSAAGLTAVAAGPAAAAAARTAAHAATSARPAADETTAAQNNLRDGWDPNEPALTQSAVEGGQFGQVFKTAVNGQVYAQPLVVGNTVIVATETDWVYGLNAKTGAIDWKTSLGQAYQINSCDDLTPSIGVTSTPVYDPNTGSVYVMALVKKTTFQFRLFGLDVSTGAITLQQQIAGSPTNDSHISFHPIPQDQRTGLLLLNGWVYAAFASHCDHTPYAGYVAGVDVEQTPVKTTLWTDEAGVSEDQAGIWQSQGGLVSDGAGRIFFTSGNGVSPAKGPGNKPPGQLAESTVRLAPNKTTGALTAKDFFSPANAPKLDAGDKDFGSGGPAGLPFGTKTFPHVVAQAGKYGRLYLLNRNNLGGRQQNSVGGDEDLFLVGHLAALFGSPGVFGDTATLTASNAAKSNDYLYYVGKNDYLRAFKVGVNGSDKPTLTDQANSTFLFGFGSGSPVVTSNGTDANSGIVWVVDSPNGGDGTNAWLGAFDATPQPKAGGGTKMHEIWSGDIGTAVKFTTAATANGMVYVGTRDGNVYGFGITSGAALRSGGTDTFADTPVHSATTAAATVTATRSITVTGAGLRAMAEPDPFTISRVTVTRHGGGTAAVKFPVSLHKGDVLRAQVRFAPTAVGGAAGAVAFTSGAGPSGKVSVPLVADGTQAGLYATYPSLSFVLNTNDGVLSNVPAGISVWAETSIVNGSGIPLRVTGVKAPTGQYTVAGLPKPGAVIKPGEAIGVQGEFTPVRIGAASSSFTITTNKGQHLTVALSGTGIKPIIKFTSVPARVNFGSVRVGHTKKIWVDITNDGNESALMSGGATQGAPFRAQFGITNGLPVSSANDLTVPILFTPHKAGPFHGLYKITWRDVLGSHSLEVPISGTGAG
jgi:putative pyrroloquinoline-quinone binding quinoprotein/ASPM-SPD-2-Hydin domain-containing protein/putative pyrroloquinoline-quinone-binding quinoprotein